MGSELYAYFDFDSDQRLESDELRELRRTPGTERRAVELERPRGRPRRRGERRARRGATKLWLDTTKIQLFDPSDGHSMTRASDNVGVA